MPSAFISHANADQKVAEKICLSLEQRGVKCWIAPRNVRPGYEYAEEIIKGIENCSAMIVVLSDHANESIFVKREVERAVSRGKAIFPVRIRDVQPSTSLELFIGSTQWIDAWQPPMERWLTQLTGAITSLDSAPVDEVLSPAANPQGVNRRDGIASPRRENRPRSRTPKNRYLAARKYWHGHFWRLMLVLALVGIAIVVAVTEWDLRPSKTGNGVISNGSKTEQLLTSFSWLHESSDEVMIFMSTHRLHKRKSAEIHNQLFETELFDRTEWEVNGQHLTTIDSGFLGGGSEETLTIEAISPSTLILSRPDEFRKTWKAIPRVRKKLYRVSAYGSGVFLFVALPILVLILAKLRVPSLARARFVFAMVCSVLVYGLTAAISSSFDDGGLISFSIPEAFGIGCIVGAVIGLVLAPISTVMNAPVQPELQGPPES